MPTIHVTDREGEQHQVEADSGVPLMETLRDLPYGVEAICGGMCSCATCHVYVADEWAGKLQPKEDDESDLLEELEHHQASSRLSCQVEVTEEMDGLALTIAPFE